MIGLYNKSLLCSFNRGRAGSVFLSLSQSTLDRGDFPSFVFNVFHGCCGQRRLASTSDLLQVKTINFLSLDGLLA